VVAEQADLHLEAEIPPGIPPVPGNPVYMRRVLDNLIGNAVKFTPSGGSISVWMCQQDDQVVVEVTDTGIGISLQQHERIFDRFYQIDGSVNRKYGGVGLGLALVKEIVVLFGGQVTVESQVGQGSTFRVSLPVFSA
jgi:signal transduction histidine kinase